MFSMEKRIRNFITTEEEEACRDSFLILGQPTRRAIHFGAPGDIKRVIWRTACKVSTSTSSCTTTKCSSDIGGVQVCRLTKRTPWDSCTTLLLSSPTLPPCTSQPESPVSSDPCTTCGRRGASKKKKVLVQGLMQRAHPGLVGSSRGWKHQLNLNHQEFTVWHQKALDKDRKVHH